MGDAVATLRDALARRYEIRSEIGRGAFAGVYLALDLRHDREVAIKVLEVDPSSETGELRFLREIKLLARLQHPHILPLYDSGFVGAMLYYVTPYLPGESLRGKITRERRLALPEALQIAKESSEGLHFAHRHGIIHRDIKPENILLSDGHAVVADFGVARLIGVDLAPMARLTKPGLGSPGTPAYMSPEQLLGEGQTDARSDVYSLGCVLYELLTGKPPFGGKEGFVTRFTERAPVPSSLRPEIPPSLDQVVAQALEREPDARFDSAHSMCEALSAVMHELPTVAPAAQPRSITPIVAAQSGIAASGRRSSPLPFAATAQTESDLVPVSSVRQRHRVWWTVGGAVVPIVVLIAVAKVAKPTAVPLDQSTYVVLPFADRRPETGRSDLGGDEVGLMASDALARWRDIKQVGALRVSDELARRSRPRRLAEAIGLARDLGAGRLVWGEVTRMRDTTVINAALVDVALGTPVGERTERLPPGGDSRASIARLTDGLIGARIPGTTTVTAGTRSLAAWAAYERGRSALSQWDLPTAEAELTAAAHLDPGFASASLWLAEVMAWSETGYSHRDEWSAAATRAWARRGDLGEQDTQLATAVRALSDQRFPEACAAYRGLITSDSLDFVPWYGLGECNARDPLVVRDPRSPSGWSHRGSAATAVGAYERALRLVPSVHVAFSGIAFTRLLQLLHADAGKFRKGFAVTGDDTIQFASFPALDHDTLAFVPYRIADLETDPSHTEPSSGVQALERGRAVLRRVALSWVAAFPSSAHAHEAVARVLETAGDIDASRAGTRSAVSENRLARMLTRDPLQALRLAQATIRLRVKLADFSGAQALGDSLLDHTATPDSMQAALLSGVALLLGKPHRAAALASAAPADTTSVQAGGRTLPVPAGITRLQPALIAYAALGAPPDSLMSIRAVIDHLLQTRVPAARRDAVRAAVLARPMSFAYSVLGTNAVIGLHGTGNEYLMVEQDISRGDTVAARIRLTALNALHRRHISGSISMDAAYLAAMLNAMVGDTLTSIAYLDAALGDLSALRSSFLDDEPFDIGGLVRGAALRAEIAIRRRDAVTAKRWAGALAALWAQAEPSMGPALGRMRRIAQGTDLTP
ncbi:MAG: hypothetical protein NVS4B3_03040 [Gemmatimonadaceae bacterium]